MTALFLASQHDFSATFQLAAKSAHVLADIVREILGF